MTIDLLLPYAKLGRVLVFLALVGWADLILIRFKSPDAGMVLVTWIGNNTDAFRNTVYWSSLLLATSPEIKSVYAYRRWAGIRPFREEFYYRCDLLADSIGAIRYELKKVLKNTIHNDHTKA